MLKSVFLLLILSCSFKLHCQTTPVLLPQKISIAQGKCDSTVSIIDSLLKQIQDEDFQPSTKFYNDHVESIDLNNDGQCEYIIKYYNGGVYIQHEIFQVQNSELIKIGHFEEGSYSFAEYFNGWPQIILSYYEGDKTNPIWKFMLFRHDGKQYTKFYDPGLNYGSLLELGLKAFNSKDYQLAEIYFRNILTIYGNGNPTDVNNLALSLIRQKKYSESKVILHNHLNKSENPSTYYNLSLIYKAEDNLKEELFYLKKSYDLKPSNSKKNRILELESLLD